MTGMDVGRVRRAATWLLLAMFSVLGTGVAAAEAKAPALKLSKPTGAPASVVPGQTFTVDLTVRNATKRRLKARTATVSFTKLKLAGGLKVKALAARKSAKVKGTVTVPKTAAAGTYKLT